MRSKLRQSDRYVGANRHLRCLAAAICIVSAAALPSVHTTATPTDTGDDWAGYGRTAAQTHYSPLETISLHNVGQLGLDWFMNLPAANSVTQPIAVDGTLYFAAGLSIVHAVDAASGELLWRYDPRVGEVGGLNLRVGWGVRGVAWRNGRIYVGTQDGRLISLNARNGEPVWIKQTFTPDTPAYISGAPRVFDDKVLIGFGSTTGAVRGYISAYHVDSGELLWRFWTTPGNPDEGFENDAMAMAADTWSGEWWQYGGGGTVWNSMAYDAETDTVYIGTGSPYPWNHGLRSQGEGDNLFTVSIVALDASSGDYKWHYQVNPADTWDFDATMDIQLADLEIDGEVRKVLMQAPKNGFFYVIDRVTGELISAEAFARVSWASHIDLDTGRPVENPKARFDGEQSAVVTPGSLGAHNWMPMAYSPRTGLVYIPAQEFDARYSELPGDWTPPQDRSFSGGQMISGGPLAGMTPATGSLLAWSPARQEAVWEIPYPTSLNGGVLATGGDLVFQGSIDNRLRAYSGVDGSLVWEFDVGAPILAPPITYEAGGQQYLTVLTGTGMGIAVYAGSMIGPEVDHYDINPRSQARRVLTFRLNAATTLPERVPAPPPPDDHGFVLDRDRAMTGMLAYATHCTTCHGDLVIGVGNGPDLRRSSITFNSTIFEQVVRSGLFQTSGMPGFPELSEDAVEDIRHYVRARADELRQKPGTTSLQIPASMGL